jgi:hypothetical protein
VIIMRSPLCCIEFLFLKCVCILVAVVVVDDYDVHVLTNARRQCLVLTRKGILVEV